MKRLIIPLTMVCALALSACEEEAAPAADTSETGGVAAGEVLGGTINDDMIAFEELTSTSPPAERRAANGSAGNGQGAGVTAGEDNTSGEVSSEAETDAADAEPAAPADEPAAPPEEPETPGQ